MNRRSFLATAAAAALVPFVRPAPRPRIDLMTFCGDSGTRFDTKLPCVVGDHTFATDTKICVRVGSLASDAFDHNGRIPPFHDLNWSHDAMKGWKTPRPKILTGADRPCWACEGFGATKETRHHIHECERCGGFGCELCDLGGDIFGPGAVKCPECKGKAYGTFPSIVELNGVYFDRHLYNRLATVGDFEFCHGEPIDVAGRMVEATAFRFDGGVGLVMPMDAKSVERSIRLAQPQ